MVRLYVRFTGVVAVIAVIYLTYVFMSRRSAGEQWEALNQPRTPPGVPAELLTTSLKITHFYAAQSPIQRGDETNLCYGVLNAASLSLQPPVEDVSPSLSRCFTVRPQRSTRYTLTATAKNGKKESASVELMVLPGPALVQPQPHTEPPRLLLARL